MKKTIFLLFFLLPAFSFARTRVKSDTEILDKISGECGFFFCETRSMRNFTMLQETITNDDGSFLVTDKFENYISKILEQCNQTDKCKERATEIQTLVANATKNNNCRGKGCSAKPSSSTNAEQVADAALKEINRIANLNSEEIEGKGINGKTIEDLLDQCGSKKEDCKKVVDGNDQLASFITSNDEDSSDPGAGTGQGAEVAGQEEGADDTPEWFKKIKTHKDALDELNQITAENYNDYGKKWVNKLIGKCKDLSSGSPGKKEKCVKSGTKIETALKKVEGAAFESIAEQMRDLKNRCTQNHNNVKQQRRNIESETQQLQAEIDRVDDQILQAQSNMTIAEDNFKQRQLNKEQQYRRTKEAQETKIRNLKLKDKQLERDIMDNLSKMEEARIKMVTSIKDLEIEKQNACSNRFEKYINASKACYDKSVEQTLAERKEFNTKIQSGNFQVASLSKLINFNENSIQKKFKNRLTQLHQQCYKQTVGENLPSSGKGLRVQVSCDLATLEKRKKMCEQSQNKGSLCPQGLVAIEAENAVLEKMRSIEKVIASSKRALKMSEQTIALKSESMRDQSAEIKEQLIAALKELPILDEKFNKEIQFEKNKVAHARKSNENKLLSLEKEKVRLLAMDPARHFKESIEEAQYSCCTPISTTVQKDESENVEVAENEDDKAEAEESESVEVAETEESEGDK